MTRFLLGAVVGALAFVVGSVAQIASTSPPIPIPLPLPMGGTGSVIGPIAGQSTVGALPTCNAAAKGQILFVTDSLLPALGVTIAAGGAVNVLVFCNGTSWIAG